MKFCRASITLTLKEPMDFEEAAKIERVKTERHYPDMFQRKLPKKKLCIIEVDA